MRILQVHNFYQQAGGEDRVVADELALLARHGHFVQPYRVHNDAVNGQSLIQLGAQTIWNQATYREIRQVIREQRIELMHVHNTLPLVSPAVYWAAAHERVAVVQTLHNYRLLCPAAILYRAGQVCELCVRKSVKWPAAAHRCYRNSFGASAAVSAMLALHTLGGTYRHKVTAYIALTEFARRKFCEGGLPAERVVVKPNFLAEDPGAGSGEGGYAFFAGRLTEEKGLAALLDAWSASRCQMPLKIAGDGPMQGYVRDRAAAIGNVEYLGSCERAHLLDLLKNAAFLALPSRWYEGMPMIALEAMACGTPVVACALGSMNDLIVDGENGIKLESAVRNALSDFLSGPSDALKSMRASTRRHFEQHYTAKLNYLQLIGIYESLAGKIVSASLHPLS